MSLNELRSVCVATEPRNAQLDRSRLLHNLEVLVKDALIRKLP